MAYLEITFQSPAMIGPTVDAKISVKSARVTLLTETALRIEPNDDACAVFSVLIEDDRATIYAVR